MESGQSGNTLELLMEREARPAVISLGTCHRMAETWSRPDHRYFYSERGALLAYYAMRVPPNQGHK